MYVVDDKDLIPKLETENLFIKISFTKKRKNNGKI